MSVQIIGINPGANLEAASNYSGGTIVTDNIELNVNMATTIVNDASVSGGTRQINKGEVLLALELMQQYVTRMNWPPVSS